MFQERVFRAYEIHTLIPAAGFFFRRGAKGTVTRPTAAAVRNLAQPVPSVPVWHPGGTASHQLLEWSPSYHRDLLCIVNPSRNYARPSRIVTNLIKILLEPRKTLLGPKALATFCEVLVEFVLDLIKILLGLAEFLLGFTIHNKSR